MSHFSLSLNKLLLTAVIFISTVCFASAREKDVEECFEERTDVVIMEEDSIQRFNFILDMPKGYLSGIMILREAGDRTVGSIVNEFGISALDFKFDAKRNKIQLLNVVSFLDKWYIRKVLKKDLAYTLKILKDGKTADKKGYEVGVKDNIVEVLNKRYKLKYSFESYEAKK